MSLADNAFQTADSNVSYTQPALCTACLLRPYPILYSTNSNHADLVEIEQLKMAVFVFNVRKLSPIHSQNSSFSLLIGYTFSLPIGVLFFAEPFRGRKSSSSPNLLFIWLCWVFSAAGGIFHLYCSMWDMWLRHVGSSSLTRD